MISSRKSDHCARRVTLDLDVLRSFVTGIELGSFAKAANRLGRSTSAVSTQLKKLEEQTGTAIFRKAGRSLALTDAGETMLAYARRLIELNDEAVAAVRGVDMEGWVRLGLQEDFGETLLPRVLGQFARAHPKVRIEARIARNAELIERVIAGQLDLALAWSDGTLLPRSEPIAQVPLCWIGPAELNNAPHFPKGEPVPLAVLEAPCLLRTIATNALDAAGIPWRIAFTSPSLSGLWAATAAGLGVMVRTPIGVPENLRMLGRGEAGLPELRSLGLVLHRADAEPDPAAARLASILIQAIHEVLPHAPRLSDSASQHRSRARPHTAI